MELTVNDNEDLGFSGLLRMINGDTSFAIGIGRLRAAQRAIGDADRRRRSAPLLGRRCATPATSTRRGDRDRQRLADRRRSSELSATNGDINIVSAPHILTSDNEEAEIRVGDNIPIISSRVRVGGRASTTSTAANLALVGERRAPGHRRDAARDAADHRGRQPAPRDLPGDHRDQQRAPGGVGNAEDVGVALSNRRVENTVVVRDGETVVIGGLLSDTTDDTVTKVPWLGDIPILGWAFKSTKDRVRKTNLLVFLTPRIVRTPLDLENDTIRRREEFQDHSGQRARDLRRGPRGARRSASRTRRGAGRALRPARPPTNPVSERLAAHSARYPAARVKEIEAIRAEERAKAAATPRTTGPALPGPGRDRSPIADKAAALLTDLIDSGHDGTLVSSPFGDTRRLRDPPRAVRDARAGERGRRGGAQVARPHARDPRASKATREEAR